MKLSPLVGRSFLSLRKSANDVTYITLLLFVFLAYTKESFASGECPKQGNIYHVLFGQVASVVEPTAYDGLRKNRIKNAEVGCIPTNTSACNCLTTFRIENDVAKVVDSVNVSKYYQGKLIGIGWCYPLRNNKHVDLKFNEWVVGIAAGTHSGVSQYSSNIKAAWKVDETTLKLTPYPAKNFVCHIGEGVAGEGYYDCKKFRDGVYCK